MVEASSLSCAWERRGRDRSPCRVFHGPGEAIQAESDLQNYTVDEFKSKEGDAHYWVTAKSSTKSPIAARSLTQLTDFYRLKGARSIALYNRPMQARGEGGFAGPLWGDLPEPFIVQEGAIHYEIRFRRNRHPGLFLDHAPLRHWLLQTGPRVEVLNTFCYTGSLGLAAAKGGAACITSIDLSHSALEWAERNYRLNGLDPKMHPLIQGDVLQILPRWARVGRSFDLIILDPPSFSHGAKGNFVVTQDLERLHTLALRLLRVGGTLVTASNCAQLGETQMLGSLEAATKTTNSRLAILRRIELPESYPTQLGHLRDRYLKGFILLRI